MPLQNRAQPNGDIIAHPARGQFMGNRGILHDDAQKLGTSRWRHKAWVCCALEFKNRKRQVMAPHNYTELFFYDEAVALAAGHRPCAECRRDDFMAFKHAFEFCAGRRLMAPEMDQILHPERVTRNRQKITYWSAPEDLPDGTFIRHENQAHIVWANLAISFSPIGYGATAPLPKRQVEVLTPRTTVAVMAAGYRAATHEALRSRFS
mgnify:CR=1 FL=1